MASGISERRGRLRADINITPLVDVVLVLLIIFMIMTPIWLKHIDLEVADTVTTDSAKSEQVVLTIDASGALSLNQEPVPREALRDRVRAVFERRRDKVLFLDVEDEANYGYAVGVMDACRGAGVAVLGITPR